MKRFTTNNFEIVDNKTRKTVGLYLRAEVVEELLALANQGEEHRKQTEAWLKKEKELVEAGGRSAGSSDW